MTLADYLAKNYLSTDAEPRKSKKRKRKDRSKAEGLTIADDDLNGWTKRSSRQDADEGDAPLIVDSGLNAGLTEPAKRTAWIKVGSDAPSHSEQAAADAILAGAAAESKARDQEDDDQPAVVDENGEGVDGPMMASGAMAGLQTAEQITTALKRREKAEKKAAADLDPTGLATKTIFRDASGRILNVAKLREESKLKQAEEERKTAQELESRKGDVQRQQGEDRKRELQEAKIMPFTRTADDKTLNDELKERERWNDPMAPMLGQTKSSKGGKKAGKRDYQGAFEPNRYGIRPGFRWDGVDRGNGFERKWFAARNKQKDREALEYMWQMDE